MFLSSSSFAFSSCLSAFGSSPAGGNFEEPVTQSTLGTVKTFLGLSAERAYKRYYPSVDPLLSWSRYLKQLQPWYDKEIDPDWTKKVQEMIEERKKANVIDNCTNRIESYEYKVKPFLDKIRYHIDKLELIVDDQMWPLPKYRELLFNR